MLIRSSTIENRTPCAGSRDRRSKSTRTSITDGREFLEAALLGDAAQAMLPHLGQGANQAIEDAVALAVFLERHKSGEIVAILRHYELSLRTH